MSGMIETRGDPSSEKGSPVGAIILVGALLVLLAGTIAFAWYTWRMMDVEVGFGGMVIAAVGSAVGILLGVVLMRLCYISSRRGYDDDVGKDCRVPPGSGGDAPGGIGETDI